jgi:hypothetical protein
MGAFGVATMSAKRAQRFSSDVSRFVAAGVVAVAVTVGFAPAKAATVNDFISFTDTGTYATNGDPVHGYQGGAIATGSFNIKFDPTQLYLAQPITGIITNLTYSVTDPFFQPLPLSLDQIKYFAFDGAGTLTLSSDQSLTKSLSFTMGITIGINGWAYGTGSSTWYSQDSYGNTLTSSGTATISASATPLPAALPLLASGLGALGVVGWRRKKKLTRAA